MKRILLAILAAAVLSACVEERSTAVAVADQSRKDDVQKLVAAALEKQDVAMPTKLTLEENGWLVAVYQDDAFDKFSNRERALMAERLVLAIRNGIYDKGITNKYRVTFHGKSPGPGLVRKLGSGRFIEGGGFTFGE